MNAIEKFKRGRKVKTRFGEFIVGHYIKHKNENFWRRVNSDGTLTRVGDRSYEYNVKNVKNNQVIKDTNSFISDRNKQDLDLSYELENPNRVGVYDNYLIPYKDPNGEDMDVGPGLALEKAIHKADRYTHDEVNKAHASYVNKTDSILYKNFLDIGASFDNLHPKFKALARDVKYQNGPNSKSPKMWRAMVQGDTLKALLESRATFKRNNKKYWDNSRVARRAEALWPGMYNTSTDQQRENFEISKK